MHRVLTNNQLKIMQTIIEHLSQKMDKQVTITEFLESCQYNGVINQIIDRIKMVEKHRFDIINEQIKSKHETGKRKILVKLDQKSSMEVLNEKHKIPIN